MKAMNGILKELGVQLLPNTKIKQLIGNDNDTYSSSETGEC